MVATTSSSTYSPAIERQDPVVRSMLPGETPLRTLAELSLRNDAGSSRNRQLDGAVHAEGIDDYNLAQTCSDEAMQASMWPSSLNVMMVPVASIMLPPVGKSLAQQSPRCLKNCPLMPMASVRA
ncbi:MAG: hypothetical protein Q8N51_01900 [Gammaproteobacteria bacterium]|nr:hypothetical protein [Gammaproteobacteria bacterium]